MSSAANPQTMVHPLADLSKIILLAGAGKMGGALLQGWMALGLSPAKVVVLEPQPSLDIEALTERGLRLNPPRDSVGDTAAAEDAAEQVSGVRQLHNELRVNEGRQAA